MANNENFKGIKIVKAAPISCTVYLAVSECTAYLALSEDNELFHWQEPLIYPNSSENLHWSSEPEKLMDNVSDFFIGYSIFIIKENDLFSFVPEEKTIEKILDNIRWAEDDMNFALAIDNDDNLYAWGYVPSLFVTDTDNQNFGRNDKPVKIMENVRSAVTDGLSITIVLNNGEMYCCNPLDKVHYDESTEKVSTTHINDIEQHCGDRLERVSFTNEKLTTVYFVSKNREIAVDDYSGEKYVKPKRVF